jgi:hypothetical protein
MKKLILALILTTTAAAAEEAKPVKLSENGICHTESSTHYNRTKNYTAYDTLDECLAAGGRLPRN